MSSEDTRHFNFPPRHDFKSLQETGIKTNFPFGRTIITASFASHKDPHNENPQIDFSARENAVWLTYKDTVEGQSYDFIIGPDGETSPVAIHWNKDKPEIFILEGGKMRKIEGIDTNKKAKFINTPADTTTSLMYKKYIDPPNSDGNLTEFYGIMRLPAPTDVNLDHMILFPRTYAPFISKETLVSGMRNRKWLSRSSTTFWAVRVTDKSEVPFGRELTRKK